MKEKEPLKARQERKREDKLYLLKRNKLSKTLILTILKLKINAY